MRTTAPTRRITYEAIDEQSAEGQEILAAVKEEAIEFLGYFLKPSELFHAIASRGNGWEKCLYPGRPDAHPEQHRTEYHGHEPAKTTSISCSKTWT
jgi:hypothetical protein